MQRALSRRPRRFAVAASVGAACVAIFGCAPADESASPEPRVSRADVGADQADHDQEVARPSSSATSSSAPPRPAGFTGEFSTMDELQRCKAAPNVVVCASVLSGQKVVLGPAGADYKGEVATGFPAAEPLGLGNSITTASGATCENTSRGIECYRGGHGFVIGDSAVVVLRGPNEDRFEPTVPEPEPDITPTPAPDEPEPYDDGCDPNYEGACIPAVPYDLDCGDVYETDFYSVGSDPNNFDGDYDGIACETY